VIESGDLPALKEILALNPDIDVNVQDSFGFGPLHWACYRGHPKTVELLLLRRDLAVNLQSNSGSTPFLLACYFRQAACIGHLLRDTRVQPNIPEKDGTTPCYYLVRHDSYDLLEQWIASGRYIDVGSPEKPETDAIRCALNANNLRLVTLLERLVKDPEATIQQSRESLQVSG